MCIDMTMDTCMDMPIDMCIDMRMDMCICIYMCAGMRIDMRMDMSMAAMAAVWPISTRELPPEGARSAQPIAKNKKAATGTRRCAPPQPLTNMVI